MNSSLNKIRTGEREGLPGESYYNVQNSRTREYKCVWAKDREQAIRLLGWDGDVKWVMWIKDIPLKKPDSSNKTTDKINGKLTLEQELQTIDKTLNREAAVKLISVIVDRRRKEKGETTSKEKLKKMSEHYYYRFVRQKSTKKE